MKREEITVSDVLEQLEYKPTTGDFVRKVKINQSQAGSVAGTTSSSGARQIKVKGVDFMDYDLAWLVTHGKHASGQVLHRDGDKSNCKLENLMVIDPSELTHEILVALLDYDQDTGEFIRRVAVGSRSPAGSAVGCLNKKLGYVVVGVLGKLYFAHRLAWFYVTGSWPSDQIDHINGVRSDNRFENLRDVSGSINSQNKRVALKNNKSSGLLGVTWSEPMQAYMAYIGVDGKRTILGYKQDKNEAHQMYVEAKRRMHAGCTI